MAQSSETEEPKKWLRYAIFVHESTTDLPPEPIDFFKNPHESSRRAKSRDAYWKVAGGSLTVLALITAFVGQPTKARAFWPFSIPSADAANPAVVHDASLPLLQAATNLDPNPTKIGVQLALSDGAALVADAGPSGTLADIASTTPSDRISVYVVRPGDTIQDVAKLYDVSVNTIVWANNLGSSRTLTPGQTLVILPVSGVQHTILKGETIKGIARRFSSSSDQKSISALADDIASFNGLDPEAALNPGDTIIIPGGELAGAAPVVVKPKRRIGGANPYRGGSGADLEGYFSNPLPGAMLTQGIHGWNGVDLAAPRGTPILAAAAGSVIIARQGGWNGGYGSYVVIAHDNGTETLYAHMSRVSAQVGEEVGAGDVIGYEGASGDATGPHLHFEVRGALNPFANCVVRSYCQPQ